MEEDNGSGSLTLFLTNKHAVEIKILGWFQLDDIFWLFVLVGPP